MRDEVAIGKIRNFHKKKRRMPSYKEMCSLFGLSSNSKQHVSRIVNRLVEAELLEKDKKGRLVLAPNVPPLPMLYEGEMSQYTKDKIMKCSTFDELLIKNPDSYCIFKVSGTTMHSLGIYEGDLAIVDKERRARNNDIVIVNMSGRIAIKHLRRKHKNYLLVDMESEMIPYPGYDLKIEGVVMNIIRSYH